MVQKSTALFRTIAQSFIVLDRKAPRDREIIDRNLLDSRFVIAMGNLLINTLHGLYGGDTTCENQNLTSILAEILELTDLSVGEVLVIGILCANMSQKLQIVMSLKRV